MSDKSLAHARGRVVVPDTQTSAEETPVPALLPPEPPSRPHSTTSAAAGERVIVVMPAYNAVRTLQRTYDDLPHDRIADVILVDDGSRDGTIEAARGLGLKIFAHDRNYGYGANQKTCYAEALQTDATIIVMVHPDYQYDPRLLPDMIAPIEAGEADVVFGSRMRGISALQQGMPWWKYYSNRVLTWLENQSFGLSLSEFHTGYRAYSRRALESVNFSANSDGFIFDQEIVAQCVECGFRFQEIGVPVRYFPEASSASISASIAYGLGILRLLLRYALHRNGLLPSMQFTCLRARYRRIG